MPDRRSLLTRTDVYKFGHRHQYPPGTTHVGSYLESRGTAGPGLEDVVFFGLTYYLREYLGESAAVTAADVDRFAEVSEAILRTPPDVSHLRELAALGRVPLRIRTLPEGTVAAPRVPLMTVENTVPGFGWLVNYVETLLMKVWCPITVATNGLRFRRLFERLTAETCDNAGHVPFQMHDFGYRGVSSEETAAIASAAHLANFLGTDTTAGALALADAYNGGDLAGVAASVPASEHSVMCSWGESADDFDALANMLDVYPTGVVSVVADTYDLWRFVDEYAGRRLKDRILARDGRFVVRPDSGDPETILCGDPDAADPRARAGVVRLLDDRFGSAENAKGYRVLNPKVGVIQGDGVTYDRVASILSRLKAMGYASSNVLFGSGGALLQKWNRDTLKMAIKASWCVVNGVEREISKDPVTDPGKRSKVGRLRVDFEAGRWQTTERATAEQAAGGMLRTVYEDGRLVDPPTMADVRRLLADAARP